MNIAFPALLISLLILPGLFFTLAFYNTDNKQLNYISLTHKTALSLFVTFLLHLIGLLLVTLCTHHQIDLALFLIFIYGAQSSNITGALGAISNFEIMGVAIYLLIIYILAFSIGKLFRYLIAKFKLDKQFNILRLNSPWYYLFTGYDWEDGKPDGVLISACMELAGQGYLYQGYLERFFLDESGNIDRLVLTNTERREIEHDKPNEKNKSPNQRFYPIDGHFFVIQYSEVKNLNVQFIKFNAIK